MGMLFWMQLALNAIFDLTEPTWGKSGVQQSENVTIDGIEPRPQCQQSSAKLHTTTRKLTAPMAGNGSKFCIYKHTRHGHGTACQASLHPRAAACKS